MGKKAPICPVCGNYCDSCRCDLTDKPSHYQNYENQQESIFAGKFLKFSIILFLLAVIGMMCFYFFGHN